MKYTNNTKEELNLIDIESLSICEWIDYNIREIELIESEQIQMNRIDKINEIIN